MVDGTWIMEYGLWIMEYGIWITEYGICNMGYGKLNIEHWKSQNRIVWGSFGGCLGVVWGRLGVVWGSFWALSGCRFGLQNRPKRAPPIDNFRPCFRSCCLLVPRWLQDRLRCHHNGSKRPQDTSRTAPNCLIQRPRVSKTPHTCPMSITSLCTKLVWPYGQHHRGAVLLYV